MYLPELPVGAPKEYAVPKFSFLLATGCVKAEAPGVPVLCRGLLTGFCSDCSVVFDVICVCVIPFLGPACIWEVGFI